VSNDNDAHYIKGTWLINVCYETMPIALIWYNASRRLLN